MAYTDTEQGVVLTTLRAGDEADVRAWLTAQHRAGGRAWASALGEAWSGSELDAQLLAADVVEQAWLSLRHAARDPDHLVVVARLDGRALGVLWLELGWSEPLHTRVGDLRWVYVATWARRNGVATGLVEAAREWLRLRGVRGLTTSARACTPATVAFFARVGLRVADVRLAGSVGPG